MEEITCIFCDIGSQQIIIKENDYAGKRCSNCGLIFISPRPTFSEIMNVYGHDQAFASAESHITNEFFKRLYARHDLVILKKYIKEGSLLEIGAGAGYFLDEARKQGFEVYGIELNPVQANFISNTFAIPCETTPLDASSFAGKKFDVIYSCDVLSHFYDPIAELQKINNKLNDNGVCIFETGNFADVEQKYLEKIESFHYPDHLFFFGENTIKELLSSTGFQFTKMYSYSIVAEQVIDKGLAKTLRILGYTLKLMTRTKNHADDNNSRTTTAPKTPSLKKVGGLKAKLRRAIKQVNDYLVYLSRYKIGAVLPKKGRPQTVIVIAKKV